MIPGLIPVRIAGTASLPAGRAVPTAELVARIDPPPALGDVLARTGIASRHFADPETPVSELAARALGAALAASGMPATALSRIVFVTSTGGDVQFPATANLVAARLGLSGTCDCIDLGNACLGFVTAFDMAARGLATGQGPVGIAVVELGSRCITPEDPRPYVVFADGVAAAVLDHGREDEGILASWLRNDGLAGGDVVLARSAVTGRPETIRFMGSNKRITADAVAWIRRSADAALAQAGLRLEDVAWVLPHQPNGVMLELIVRELGVDPARVVPMVADTGSVGAASIPISLDRLWRSGRVRDRDRIMMVGVGAGISAGALIVQVRT
jgi:3-oxoacyl-(acyl-carrier-protein) synthase III